MRTTAINLRNVPSFPHPSKVSILPLHFPSLRPTVCCDAPSVVLPGKKRSRKNPSHAKVRKRARSDRTKWELIPISCCICILNAGASIVPSIGRCWQSNKAEKHLAVERVNNEQRSRMIPSLVRIVENRLNIGPRVNFARLRCISVAFTSRRLISSSRARIDRAEFLCGFVRTPRTPHGCRFRRKFRFVACFRLSVEIRQWHCAMQNILFLSLVFFLFQRAVADQPSMMNYVYDYDGIASTISNDFSKSPSI